MFRLILVPHRAGRPGRFAGGVPARIRPRGIGWRLFEALIFLATLLLAWLLSARVAGSAAPADSARASLEEAENLSYYDLARALGERWRSEGVRDGGPGSTAKPAEATWALARLYDLAMASAAAAKGSGDPGRRLEGITAALAA